MLVKSNQELHERIADLETAVASRDQQIDEIRSELSDIVSRLEAVESGREDVIYHYNERALTRGGVLADEDIWLFLNFCGMDGSG